MRRPGFLLLALAVVAAAAGAAAARPASHDKRKRGRVQRVERSTERVRNICQLRSKQQPGHTESSHTCWGKKPTLGAVGAAIDEEGYRATVKVTEIIPEIDACGQEIRWYIQLETLVGSTSSADDSGTFVVFGFDLPGSARTRSDVGVPEDRAHESLWTGFGRPDEPAALIVTFYTCDRPGSRLPSDQIWNYCIEYYLPDGGGFRSVGTDYVPACSTE